mmetsp:Transcript_25880/g.29865  ORF Transcript_25880/g.29865 Transcript_25880/m.29865 type:complete len:154 (+) Transcript_25880:59-520(+)
MSACRRDATINFDDIKSMKRGSMRSVPSLILEKAKRPGGLAGHLSPRLHVVPFKLTQSQGEQNDSDFSEEFEDVCESSRGTRSFSQVEQEFTSSRTYQVFSTLKKTDISSVSLNETAATTECGDAVDDLKKAFRVHYDCIGLSKRRCDIKLKS